jgi:hypothetical protein
MPVETGDIDRTAFMACDATQDALAENSSPSCAAHG